MELKIITISIILCGLYVLVNGEDYINGEQFDNSIDCYNNCLQPGGTFCRDKGFMDYGQCCENSTTSPCNGNVQYCSSDKENAIQQYYACPFDPFCGNQIYYIKDAQQSFFVNTSDFSNNAFCYYQFTKSSFSTKNLNIMVDLFSSDKTEAMVGYGDIAEATTNFTQLKKGQVYSAPNDESIFLLIRSISTQSDQFNVTYFYSESISDNNSSENNNTDNNKTDNNQTTNNNTTVTNPTVVTDSSDSSTGLDSEQIKIIIIVVVFGTLAITSVTLTVIFILKRRKQNQQKLANFNKTQQAQYIENTEHQQNRSVLDPFNGSQNIKQIINSIKSNDTLKGSTLTESVQVDHSKPTLQHELNQSQLGMMFNVADNHDISGLIPEMNDGQYAAYLQSQQLNDTEENQDKIIGQIMRTQSKIHERNNQIKGDGAENGLETLVGINDNNDIVNDYPKMRKRKLKKKKKNNQQINEENH